jgi:high-affinity nickel-transport protein
MLNQHSGVHSVFVVIGTAVSGCFLYVIALLNITAFAGIWRVFRRLRTGDYDAPALDSHLNSRGVMSRVAQRIGKPVDKPSHMYLVGLLFGLGFDTATEIALLVVAGTGSASGLPWCAILCLPVLFAAGMSLLDTADGTFMNFAYGWSLSQPVRKIYYNLTVTALSIAVAFIVGTVELLSLLHDKLGLHAGPWTWLSAVNLNTVGFLIVGLFCVTWVTSIVVWKYARIEERWSRARPARSET